MNINLQMNTEHSKYHCIKNLDFFFQKYETQAHQATERTLLIQIGLNWHFRKML